MQTLIIVAFLILILYNLGAGLYYMLTDKGRTDRTVKSLTWRIGHSRAWRQPSRSTHSPISLMRPVSSASGMKSPGITMPVSVFQRTSASTAMISPAAEVKRVLLCTGKIYYELNKRRADLQRIDASDVPACRAEDLQRRDARPARFEVRGNPAADADPAAFDACLQAALGTLGTMGRKGKRVGR